MVISINKELVSAYLSGEDMQNYANEWFFTSSVVSTDIGHNIFVQPQESISMKERVSSLTDAICAAVIGFTPINQSIWDVLFPGWQSAEVQVDLIVGFPAPYDATTEYDPAGRVHIIFDLVQWEKYAELENLGDVVRNLLTHEIAHFLIGRYRQGVNEALTSSEYHDCLDANTFHEGFAHLLSYEAKEIGQVDWHSPQLEKAYADGKSKMLAALHEKDEEKQKEFLYTAVCGKYYEKYACMCGMIYLAKCWEKNGIEGLKREFEDYHGFAARTVDL